MQGIINTITNTAPALAAAFYIKFAQYGSGDYGTSEYGTDPSAPNTGLPAASDPDNPYGWALLIGGILIVAVSLVLFYRIRSSKQAK